MQTMLLMVCLLILVVCIGLRWLWRQPIPFCLPAPQDHEYDIIHMPKSGKCPPGFIIEPRLFAKDGEEYPGCIKASSCGHTAVIIDYLLSGESVSLLLAELQLPSSGEDSPAPDSKSNGGL